MKDFETWGVEVMLAVGFNTELPGKSWIKKPLFNPDFSMAASLNPTEKEILKLIAIGETDAAIGSQLSLTAQAVTAVISNIFKKIDAPDRFQALLWAGKNL